MHIVAFSIPLQVFPMHPLTLETQLFIQRDSTVVVAKHRELYAMQIEFIKGKSEHQLHDFVSVTLPPVLCLPNGDTYAAHPMRP